jgi:dihydroxyacetone kinase
MKKLLLASSILLMAAPAFADTTASSSGQINGVQGTYSTADVEHGAVVVGTVAGNYTAVNSNAAAHQGNNPTTSTNVTTVSVGGTVSGGAAKGGANGNTGGIQGTTFTGKASATATTPPQFRW